MIQNFSYKHALLNAFAEILPRGSVLLCFTRLTHTAINFPQRQIFGLLTSIYWTLTEVAWDIGAPIFHSVPLVKIKLRESMKE